MMAVVYAVGFVIIGSWVASAIAVIVLPVVLFVAPLFGVG